MVSWPKTNFTDFAFEHNEQGIHEPSLKYTGNGTGKSYSFQIDVYLGTSIEEQGGMETEITNRLGAG